MKKYGINVEGEMYFLYIKGIIELYALCKGGNFDIHIWALFGYFIC